MKEYQRETIAKSMELINRKIFLPDIQRPFGWEEDKGYKLFDSLMRGYPISTMLYWSLSRESLEKLEKKADMRIPIFRFVSSNEEENPEETNRSQEDYFLVLDGQQRLPSLFIALKGNWKVKKRKKVILQELYFDLLSGDTEDEDGIRYQFQFMDREAGVLIHEEGDSDVGKPKFWMNVKRIYEQDLGTSAKRRNFLDSTFEKYQGLEGDRQTISDNLDTFNDVLKENGVINFFPEDEVDYDKVLDIFVRTNSGGLKLGYSDLLFSKIKLGWNSARTEFKELLNDLNGHNFDFDTDFLLKTCLMIFAGKTEEIKYSTMNINKKFTTQIRESWEAISKAVRLSGDALDDFLISDEKHLPSYNALIPLIYWFYKERRRGLRGDDPRLHDEIKNMRVWFIKALLSGIFGSGSDLVLYKCKESLDEAAGGFFPAQALEASIATIKGRSMDLKPETFDTFQYRAKESYLFLSLCYKAAINFRPIMKGNAPEQDHIFSRDELTKAGVDEKNINSIYNIRYVTLADNRSKKAMPYEEWVGSLGNRRKDVFATHLIPEGEWTVETFAEYLKARKRLMLEALEY